MAFPVVNQHLIQQISTARPKYSRVQTFIAMLIAAILCCLFLPWALPLRQLAWHLPFYSVGDGLSTSLIVKTVIQEPWYLSNPRLGAPTGAFQWYDFPLSDSLNIAILKVFGVVTHSYGLAINLYFLAGFVLVAWTALFVMRELGLSFPSSISGAVLFAFAPYHFYRGEAHLFLSSYYVVPLTVLVILWMAWQAPVLRDPWSFRSGQRIPRLTTIGWIGIIVCMLTGCAGIYYAFFAVLLMLGVALRNCVSKRHLRSTVAPLCLAGVIGMTALINVSPNVVYMLKHGRNEATASRDPSEAELYGLKVLQLLLPVHDHRVPIINKIRNLHGNPIHETESDYASLGLLGAVGLGVLMFGALSRRQKPQLLQSLSFLTILSILIGAVGGLGPALAYFLSAQIRCYNRISIYIEFFAVTALFFVFESVAKVLCSRSTNRLARVSIMIGGPTILLIGGIFDQCPLISAAPLKMLQDESRQAEQLVQKIEVLLPAGSAVLQMPYMRFPESGPIQRMEDYDPARAYLASKRLRWSYGAVPGRYEGGWLADLCQRPAPDMIERAALAEYKGIYIDRFGYEDNGVALERSLASLLQIKPLESTDHRLVFYDLRPYAQKLRALLGKEDWLKAQTEVLHPIAYQFEGCYGREGGEINNWRWCGNRFSLTFENPFTNSYAVKLRSHLYGTPGGRVFANVEGHDSQEAVISGSAEISFDKSLIIGPGRTVVHFQNNGRPVVAPGDSRRLVLRIDNLDIDIAGGHKINVLWKRGCYGLERDASTSWRWCYNPAEVVFENRTSETLTVPFSTVIATGYAANSNLLVRGPGFVDHIAVTSSGQRYQRSLTVLPGETELQFSSDAKRVEAPKDPRTLFFRLCDFQLLNPALDEQAVLLH